MAKITIVGDMLCSPRMTEIANGDYHSSFEKAVKLKNCNYLVGNLETTVAGEERYKEVQERYEL